MLVLTAIGGGDRARRRVRDVHLHRHRRHRVRRTLGAAGRGRARRGQHCCCRPQSRRGTRSFDTWTAASLALVSLAMWAFFGIIRTNHALDEARAEVADARGRGRTQPHRARPARPPRPLAHHHHGEGRAREAPRRARPRTRRAARSARSRSSPRRSLTDVRAAVSNYRIVTLAGELATAQEVLRGDRESTRTCSRPPTRSTPTLQELFGWVVREGTTNVVRHARATRCTITLARRSIEIVDDGARVVQAARTQAHGQWHRRPARAGRGGRRHDRGRRRPRGGGWRVAVNVP